MQGMHQLFRQHPLDKQNSVDDWQHAQSTVASRAHLAQHYGHHQKLNDRSVSEDSDLSPTSKEKIDFPMLSILTIVYPQPKRI